MEDSIKVSFENLKVDLQREYDQILRYHYGDYMQFPPVEQQCSNNMIAYVNLDKREPYEEVMAKIKWDG